MSGWENVGDITNKLMCMNIDYIAVTEMGDDHHSMWLEGYICAGHVHAYVICRNIVVN